jgi:hypothetical protein
MLDAPIRNQVLVLLWDAGFGERRPAGLRRELEQGFLRACQSFDAQFETRMYCKAADYNRNGNIAVPTDLKTS